MINNAFHFFSFFCDMPVKHYIPLFMLLFFSLAHTYAQEKNSGSIRGIVRDQEGSPLAHTSIEVHCDTYHTVLFSDADGTYRLRVPADETCHIHFQSLGHNPDTLDIQAGNLISSYNPTLQTNFTLLRGVDITGEQERHTTMSRLQVESFEAIPDISGSIEAAIKSMPGVSSSNELSSQYSVRGGSFDENLVYVNDIEVYRPFLIRSGQQEGLSFINPDMVSSLTFSAGGFDAVYGGKMSSVLNITYKTPQQYQGSFSASMLGGSAHLEGISQNERFTHISGFRYKKNNYLLGTLDTEGDYDPQFTDIQTFMKYRLNPAFHISFLGNYANNQYLFEPERRETTFGTLTTPLNLTINYNGAENSQFTTRFGALSFNYYPSENLTIKLITSAYQTDESETFDIRGTYRIDEVDHIASPTAANDSSKNISVGSKLDHARNSLDARVYTAGLKMSYHHHFTSLKAGLEYRSESFNDQLNEWEMLDSAGYSLPYSDTSVTLYNTRIGNHEMINEKISAYLQGTRFFHTSWGEIHITGGVRTLYWSFNNTFIAKPRFNISIAPPWEHDFLFRFSTGYYNQIPFYKEIRYPDGRINKHIKPQQSIHYVFGSDYNFRAWNRPFKFTAELYYKKLTHLIPYRTDNVRIIYAGENIASGYARGIDMRINGQFVKETESWLSISLMDTKQRISSQTAFEGNQTPETDQYLPRPSDQLLNVSLLFQDYLPNNPSYRIQVNLHYGSGLPVSYPNSFASDHESRLPAYRRVDIALYKHFKSDIIQNRSILLKPFTNVSLGIEVFNLFDIKNTISYLWIKTISSNPEIPGMFAVPNYLTSRVFNVKLSCKL